MTSKDVTSERAARLSERGYRAVPLNVSTNTDMDRAILEQHLAQPRGTFWRGERQIARQREIVAELEKDGRDLRTAQALLAEFETMWVMHIADRDRIGPNWRIGNLPQRYRRDSSPLAWGHFLGSYPAFRQTYLLQCKCL